MLTLDPGMTLQDRYRLLRTIGKGGTGAVYEAVDLRLHNAVAVKQLTAQGGEALRAFHQEAELLASLRHPGLAVVIDSFVVTDSCFLVMQYIEGEDFGQLLTRAGPPSLEADVLAWGDAILGVLAYLHQHNPAIIHRDIKPSNIKLTPRGDVVLLDFGLAKGGPRSATSAGDRTGSVDGPTANYTPLEQLEWRITDARSDLYAVGATLFHLATGIPPPSAHLRAGALAAGQPDPLVAASQLNPQVSAGLSTVLARALELGATARFHSAVEMRQGLANVAKPWRIPLRPYRASEERRLDAATSSQAEVARQADLMVQVRFTDSPQLGLEDSPTRRPAEMIEPGSELVHVDYPIDEKSGRRMPARLRVELVTSDFAIEGASEQIIEVPPDDYSKRLVFLITAKRRGLCRLRVEVYAVDDVNLGTVAVATDAVTVPVGHPVLRVANLLMGLFVQEPPRMARAAARPQPAANDAPRASDQSARDSGAVGVDAALVDATIVLRSAPARAAHEPLGDPSPAPPTAIAPEAPPGAPPFQQFDQPAIETAPQRPVSLPPRESAPLAVAKPPAPAPPPVSPSASIAPPRSTPSSASTPPPASMPALTALPAPRATAAAVTGSRLPRWLFIAVPIAALAISLIVFQRSGPTSTEPPVPSSVAPTTSIGVAAAEATRVQPEPADRPPAPSPAVEPPVTPPPAAPPAPPKAAAGSLPAAERPGPGAEVEAREKALREAAKKAAATPAMPSPSREIVPRVEPVVKPPPGSPPGAIARQSIVRVLERFRAAYAALDSAAVRRVYPEAPDALVQRMREYSSMTYAYTSTPNYVSLDAYAGRAIVEITSRSSASRKDGSVQRNGVTRFTLEQRAADAAWVITAMVEK